MKKELLNKKELRVKGFMRLNSFNLKVDKYSLKNDDDSCYRFKYYYRKYHDYVECMYDTCLITSLEYEKLINFMCRKYK